MPPITAMQSGHLVQLFLESISLVDANNYRRSLRVPIGLLGVTEREVKARAKAEIILVVVGPRSVVVETC
jgi:hypothetical protein